MIQQARRPVGRPRATDPVEPCQRCGTPGGRTHPTGHRPMRMRGDAHGFAGLVCHACHCALHRRSRAIERCAGCGTDGGRSRTEGGRPLRYDGSRFDREGSWCHACVTTDPAIARQVFARFSVAVCASSTPDASAVRAEALAILSERAARGDAIEAARIAAVEGGPTRAHAARRGAARAVEEFRRTIFGPMAFLRERRE